MANCTIAQNSGPTGGGIANSGNLTAVNCTISCNSSFSGGGILASSGTVTLHNNIIINNCTNIINNDSSSKYPFNDITGSVTGTYNIIGYGEGCGLVDGTDGNDLFSDSSMPPILGEMTQINGQYVFPLLNGSIAVKAGDVSKASGYAADQLGRARTTENTICIGAMEGVDTPRSAVTYTIKTLDGDPGDGYTFLEALEAASLNKQVGNAPAGSFTEQDTIFFAEGLSGTIRLNGRQMEIYGSLRINASMANITIDAEQKNRIALIGANTDLELEHLTLKNGNSATVGGGICNYGTAQLWSCDIENNYAAQDGGGICNYNEFRMNACIVTSNSTAAGTYSGGGIGNYGGVISATNCMIADNRSNYGGGIYNSGDMILLNTTVVGNNAVYGGGIDSRTLATLQNTIVAQNMATDTGTDLKFSGTANSYNTLSSFTTWSNAASLGVINYIYDSAKPLFVDFENGDYRLCENSQAIDKGDNSLAAAAGLTAMTDDLAGMVRVLGGAN